MNNSIKRCKKHVYAWNVSCKIPLRSIIFPYNDNNSNKPLIPEQQTGKLAVSVGSQSRVPKINK